MKAKVLKVSETGKSMFVNVKLNEFDSVGMSGYVANPEGKYKNGDEIDHFPKPTGIEHRNDADGNLMTTKGDNPQPLSFLKFS